MKGGEIMNTENGFQNEVQIVNALHNKKVCELSNNMLYMVKTMFKNFRFDDIVKAFVTENYIKPDIIVQINDECHYISIKYGSSITMHEENIDTFCDFLKSIEVPDETIKILRLYHYGDGTLDGSGELRKNSIEIRYEMMEQLKSLNRTMMDKDIVKAVIDRVIFQGYDRSTYKADFIYHGDVDYGTLVSRNQIMRYLETKDWSYMDMVHIGPVVVSPHARYSGITIRYPEHRTNVQFRWSRLSDDLTYISRRFNVFSTYCHFKYEQSNFNE